jgi:hypothetical protein
MLTDSIDCDIPRFLFNSWIKCQYPNNDTYQKLDKITDIICYTILLFYLINNGGLFSNYNYLIILLFIYRVIGTIFFLISNNRKYLFYFPNFFLEICLLLMIIKYFPILKKYTPSLFFCIIVYKILLEYFMHYRIYK